MMPLTDRRPVADPHAQCLVNGCQWLTVIRAMQAAQAIIDERERTMSYPGIQALWCSRGGHAFSEQDPGRLIIPPTSARDQDGNETTIPAQAVCGEHAKGMRTRLTRPSFQEITPPRRADPDRIAALEHELGMDNEPH